MGETNDRGFMGRLVPLQSRLYRFVASLVAHRSDAEDLFQKTCLTAWEQRAAHDPSKDLFPWLCGIARNHVRHHFRSRSRGLLHLAPDVVEQLADQQLRETAREERRQQALDGCLGKLAAADRALLEGYYRDERPVRDVAASLGRSPDSVFKLLQRLRGALYDCVNLALGEDSR
jgi:RNA polymerase sigma-70 factor, ECF subfamily